MSSVDSRIVSMKFDNAQFEREANQTIGTLGKLEQSLQMKGARDGLAGVQESLGRVDFGPIQGGIDKISASFLALSTIALTALSNITNKVIDTGLQMAKSLALDPIMQGFSEYELKMGSIQTIMAGSGEPLDVVNQKLQELNTYSDKTIYSFKDMTSNIGKFTNAGLSLDVSVAAIQGVANVAALSGANAEEASRAMYNFAQSLSQGSVKLMDWKSIELANMATKEFKTELLESAVAAGTLTKTAEGTYRTLGGTVVTATKGFNESLGEAWLSTEALTSTLGRYSDATTDIGARATAAAQDVKTFSQMMDTIKESAGSGWANTFELIVGNFEEAKVLWTGINNVVGGMITSSAEARNQMLADWKTFGGREILIEGLKNAFEALMAVIKPIKDAFRDIFPAKTGGQLKDMTVAFRDFMEKLKLTGEASENLKRTFRGVFAIFSIISQVVKGVIGVIGDLIGALSSGGGGILNITGSIGDFFTGIDTWLKQGNKLKHFFDKLGEILAAPVKLISAVVGLIGDLFGGFNKAGDSADRFGQKLSPLEKFVQNISNVFDGLLDLLGRVGDALRPIRDAISDFLSGFGEGLADAFSSGNFNNILELFKVGFLGALVLSIRNFLKGGGIFGNLFGESGVKGVMDSIKETFGALTGSLEAMQTKIKADALIRIAIAVGILTLSLIALASIDSAKLAAALGAITVVFAELMGAMFILEKINFASSNAKLIAITAALILLSIAILILASAVKKLGELSWSELLRGLVGVAGALVILYGAMKLLAKDTKGFVKTAFNIMVLSIALKVLASVVKDFSEMSWSDVGQGILSLVGALAAIAFGMKIMPKNMILTAVSLFVLSISLKAIASALADFAALDWGGIGRGLAGMAGSLLILAGAMYLMPPNMIVTAISLALVGVALQIIAKALQAFGGMSWDQIAKGLTMLAGSLLLLAGGLYLMSGALPGAAALLVAAAALAILAPVLKILGGMAWDEILRGLVALAGVFVVLGLAGYILAPLVPVILALGAAVFLLGLGLGMAGLAIFLVVTALTALMALGSGAILVLGTILDTFISKIADVFEAIAQGLVRFAETIAESGSAFAEAMTTLILSMLEAVNNTMPEIFETVNSFIDMLMQSIIDKAPEIGAAVLVLMFTWLTVLRNAIPEIAQAGLDILVGLLEAIRDNLDRVYTVATDIIVEFLQTLAENAPRVADEGYQTIIAFIDGLTAAIDANSEELGRAGGRLAVAIIRGMVSGLTGGISEVARAAKDVAKSALDAAKNFLGINSPSKEFIKIGAGVGEGFVMGVNSYSSAVENSTEDMGKSALDGMKSTMAKIAEEMDRDINTNPVITPVLDLSNLSRDATRLQDMLGATVSYGQAVEISDAEAAKKVAYAKEDTTRSAPVVQFEQNNYSPKSLSTVEIYRQTKNQLSLAKEALKV